jgi:hypothetical protein
MPTRKKAKGKTKAKRKKPPVAKATTRRKTAARKKPASGTLRVGDVIHIRGHTTGQLRKSLLLFQTTGAMSAIGT